MSDIRVSVQWKTSTVFAGEEIECTIIFKNVSQVRNVRRSPSPGSQVRGHAAKRERWKEALPLRSTQAPSIPDHRISPSIPGFPQTNTRTHKPALSLSTSNGFPQARAAPRAPEGVTRMASSRSNKHRRSISIVSIGGDTVDEVPAPGQSALSGRPVRGHTRASSLQVLPRKTGVSSGGPLSAPGHDRAFTVPSPLFRSSTSFAEQRAGMQPTSRMRAQLGSDTGLVTSTATKPDRNSFSSFKFPQGPDSLEKSLERFSSLPSEKPPGSLRRALSPRPHGSANGLEEPNPGTRILSPASINGTPRSSGDFYSMSNNSTETLASEYIAQENNRLMQRPAHSRQGSYLAPSKASKPEVLMMGYTQIAGSFTIDGSLVNQSPFEEAKKKGIIGGQGGGGVVRNESTKRDSGLLGSLGWSNIGESLGGLLGSNEMSSIREMRGSTNFRSIPILSTPQSILFVDLQLSPGESKSYVYSFPLPRGIPPTHKGRALKISYSLVVGTQRAAKNTQHQIQHADIPFRVLTSVNDQGELLGHDLMSPHIILSSIATISSIESLQKVENMSKEGASSNKSNSSSPEFLSYVESLLEKPRQNSGAGLLSPTEPNSRSLTPIAEGSRTMRESIDLAILRSNAATSSRRSANRFEIARSGDRVAVIMLTRPAYRLGETVPVAIDLQESDISCFSLHVTLETSETIDPAIALRSKASIHRVTRRTHASQYESTIAAKKVLFNPVIPLNATPEFATSGINLEWRLRFEFVTSRLGDAGGINQDLDDLLEEVARDERGNVKAAVQGLACETFDVTVPLRVYGATAGLDQKTETGDIPI